ncbi:MAG: hypothetical protein ACLR1V_01820 [Coprococcus sp.]
MLPLMEMKAAAGFVNASLAVDHTRGIKDERRAGTDAYFFRHQRSRPWHSSRPLSMKVLQRKNWQTRC